MEFNCYIVKGLLRKALFAVIIVMSAIVVSCESYKNTTPERVDDIDSKRMLQGTWINDLEGNVVFSMQGDTVFYNDTLSQPVVFHVYNDTLYIENHTVNAYAIRKLTENSLCFVNSEGDEIVLTKMSKDVASNLYGENKGTVALNQGRKVKSDTIVYSGDKRFHAYTQVSPTTYKIYHQNVNNDGLKVERVYYDNIVHIALYEGDKKVFGRNITKAEFKGIVPDAYLEQAVLSDIFVQGAINDGVRFVAILYIPDSYSYYRVCIDIDKNGRKKLSV